MTVIVAGWIPFINLTSDKTLLYIPLLVSNRITRIGRVVVSIVFVLDHWGGWVTMRLPFLGCASSVGTSVHPSSIFFAWMAKGRGQLYGRKYALTNAMHGCLSLPVADKQWQVSQSLAPTSRWRFLLGVAFAPHLPTAHFTP